MKTVELPWFLIVIYGLALALWFGMGYEYGKSSSISACHSSRICWSISW